MNNIYITTYMSRKSDASTVKSVGWGQNRLLEGGKIRQKGFVAAALPQIASVALRAKVRKIESQNVVVRIAGSDPEAEHIIYSAHWDHLGAGSQGEDRIFNGAVDNATGCAMLIEFARAWAALSPRPRRSVVFLAVTGEESGLRGSEYYVRHPLFPLAAAKVNINMDGILPGGQPGGLLALGEDKTKAWPLLEEAARRFRIPLRADPRPAAGSAFRSDHFSFVKAGVSAFSLIPFDVPGEFARSYNLIAGPSKVDCYGLVVLVEQILEGLPQSAFIVTLHRCISNYTQRLK